VVSDLASGHELAVFPASPQELASFQAQVLARNRSRQHYLATDLVETPGLLLGLAPEATPENQILRAHGANPLCGDHFSVALCLNASESQIVQAHYSGEMSAISIAAAEILCGLMLNKTPSEAIQLLKEARDMLSGMGRSTLDDISPDTLGDFAIFALVRNYPTRLKTVTLPIATLLAALSGERTIVSTQ
jgi:NifU-like protein involved in Fe-S cluster formation